MFSRDDRDAGAIVGILAFIMYFITNLIVLYGSRVREYYADFGSVKLGNEPQFLASALYKLVVGSARVHRDTIKMVEGTKAFFLNDPSKARKEVSELSQIDINRDGTIERYELEALKYGKVKVSGIERLLEIMSTHPNTLNRIKALSTYL